MNALALTLRRGTVALALLLIGGCVVGDQLTTYTIHPDGSADLVVFRSNLRSTETGDKAAKELAEYQQKFDDRSEDELVRVRAAGGTVVEAQWIRRQPPLASFVHAQLPDAGALEKFLTIDNPDGTPLTQTKFVEDGARRRLTIEVTLPAKTDAPPMSPQSVARIRQALADGISETRIALSGGRVTSANGFVVAEDKQSALLDNGALEELLHTGGRLELVLEWEVSP